MKQTRTAEADSCLYEDMIRTTLPEQINERTSQTYYSFLKERFAADEKTYSRLIGRYYTSEFIYNELVKTIVDAFVASGSELHIIDPFCGDGRLIKHFLQELLKTNKAYHIMRIYVSLWDIDAIAIETARRSVLALSDQFPGVLIFVDAVLGDAFLEVFRHSGKYDICITNPPWCILKPEKQHARYLSSKDDLVDYETATDEYCNLLGNSYKYSILKRKFGRWGINLSRLGTECAMRLVAPGGICGIVLPASFFSDQVSEPLRKWMFDDHGVLAVAYYPAELRLFGTVDQSSATVVLKNGDHSTEAFKSVVYDRNWNRTDIILDGTSLKFMRGSQYVIPFGYDEKLFSIANQLTDLKPLAEYPNIKIGRELDETRIYDRLTDSGELRFIKGFMVGRYTCMSEPVQYLNASEAENAPESTRHERIVWRDVSRSSQKRRIQATLIPAGTIAGNSLGVVYIPGASHSELAYILAVVNSMVFEFQARRHLVTNHVSSGVLRAIPIPQPQEDYIRRISILVDSVLASGSAATIDELECLVAKAYGLKLESFVHITSVFELTDDELEKLNSIAKRVYGVNDNSAIIPNHYASKLSDLDKQIISYVPQGGNWKNIPESVPSRRLAQIRESYKAGKGSRSTYYGRLREGMPAYTISTYFPRPGNGCNIHYKQDRTLTQREAARLQSFPDNFEFKGSLSAINDQIGNAVPPLLAYQLAVAFPFKGQFVDLFCGAGGLSLGFTWAGWKPIIGSDINPAALETHKANIREEVICGDITSEGIIDAIVERCQLAKAENPELPLFIIGGPPCQGFSTANRYDNMNDQRNWLFKSYADVLSRIKPYGFIFENVTGILNFEQGRFFEMIKNDLSQSVEFMKTLKLNCAEYGIPQRRERVIVVGSSRAIIDDYNMKPISQVPKVETHQMTIDTGEKKLPHVVNVRDALSDLPAVVAGEDGSSKHYVTAPTSDYQSLMRGMISAEEYIARLKSK